jgi:hypothetical protein
VSAAAMTVFLGIVAFRLTRCPGFDPVGKLRDWSV